MNKYHFITEALKEEAKKNLLGKIENIKNHLACYVTKTQKEKLAEGKITEEALANSIIEKSVKDYEKNLKADLKFLDKIAEAKTPKRIRIETLWHKSKVWGYNPRTEVIINDEDFCGYTANGKASGCGYDKLSASVGEALNKLPIAVKILCDIKEKALSEGKSGTNRTLVGYGSGYCAIPYFEGGVGFSCFDSIFKKYGYKLEQEHSNNTTDYAVYVLEN